MPENISVQDTGKEFKVEVKYSLQDLGVENEDIKNRINQKVERIMGDKVDELKRSPIKKYWLLEDREAMKAKLEEHAAAMDALVMGHKEEFKQWKGIVDLEVMQFGETLEKEIKLAVNAKVEDVLAVAEKRATVSGGRRENLEAAGIKDSDNVKPGEAAYRIDAMGNEVKK